MKKLVKRVVFCFLLVVFLWSAAVVRDRNMLNENLIRLHVVANSDSQEDQSIKLQVRDAVMDSLQSSLANVADVHQAMDYLQQNLPMIQETANAVLEKAGYDGEAVVTLCKEAFDTRYYDTFTLPAGVYEALRITIGEGAGKNWWCVVFPTFCVPAAGEGFEDVAVDAGFSNALSGTLTGQTPYELRFFFLDKLGELENRLFTK